MKSIALAIIAALVVACQTQPAPKPVPVYCKTVCTLEHNCIMECNR